MRTLCKWMFVLYLKLPNYVVDTAEECYLLWNHVVRAKQHKGTFVSACLCCGRSPAVSQTHRCRNTQIGSNMRCRKYSEIMYQSTKVHCAQIMVINFVRRSLSSTRCCLNPNCSSLFLPHPHLSVRDRREDDAAHRVQLAVQTGLTDRTQQHTHTHTHTNTLQLSVPERCV